MWGAVFVAGDDVRALQAIQQDIGFGGFAGLARLDLDNLYRPQAMGAPRRCRAGGIVLGEPGLSPSPEPADTEQGHLQRGLDAHSAMSRVYGPDLLQIIETAHLGAKNMDDDVTGVDQDPVTGRHALDLGPAMAGVLDRPQQVVSDSADVTVRPPGGDDDRSGQRALVVEVDKDDVLRLVLVQPRHNQRFERRSGPRFCGRDIGVEFMVLRQRRV